MKSTLLPCRPRVWRLFPAKNVRFPRLLFAARGRERRSSSTYDNLVPEQIHGLQQLSELQQRVKAGSLTVDEALERFSDWQRAQKGMDATQKVYHTLSSSHTLDLEWISSRDQTLIKRPVLYANCCLCHVIDCKQRRTFFYWTSKKAPKYSWPNLYKHKTDHI